MHVTGRRRDWTSFEDGPAKLSTDAWKDWAAPNPEGLDGNSDRVAAVCAECVL